MGLKQLLWAALMLQGLIFCSGEEVNVVIDMISDLTGIGSITEDFYAVTADLLPRNGIPEEIRATEGEGFWLFSSADMVGPVITLDFKDRTYKDFTLKYFSMEKIEVYFQDTFLDENEVLTILPASANNQWSTFRFEVERNEVNDAPITFRLNFPRGSAAPLVYTVIDSISYKSNIDAAPTTTEPPTPTEEPTTPGQTVIDTEDGFPGTIEEASYINSASELPEDQFPSEIIASTGTGFWLFSSSSAGAKITLNFDKTFSEISLTYYNTEAIECYFQDWAQPGVEDEVKLMLPASANNEWTTFKFEITRDFLDSEPVTFRFVFPRGSEAPLAHFLLDSISYKTDVDVVTTTPPPQPTTTPEPPATPEPTTTPEPPATPEPTTTPEPPATPEPTTKPPGSPEPTTPESIESTTPNKSGTTSPSFVTTIIFSILMALAMLK